MENRKKLSIFYFIFGIGFLFLLLCIFGIMCNIEGTTSHLEFKLHRRNLEDIADKNYVLDIEDKKDERVDFLVELTKFFYNFHKKTMYYKKRLEDFMQDRKVILNRLEKTDIKIYDLSIIPNQKLPKYKMKTNPKNLPGETPKFRKQFPFSKVLKFSNKDLKYSTTMFERSDIFLLCMAQIKVTSIDRSITIKAQITEWKETPEKVNFMQFYIKKDQPEIIQLHRIIRIRDMQKAKILISGLSSHPLEVDKVEASCLTFFDMRLE